MGFKITLSTDHGLLPNHCLGDHVVPGVRPRTFACKACTPASLELCSHSLSFPQCCCCDGWGDTLVCVFSYTWIHCSLGLCGTLRCQTGQLTHAWLWWETTHWCNIGAPRQKSCQNCAWHLWVAPGFELMAWVLYCRYMQPQPSPEPHALIIFFTGYILNEQRVIKGIEKYCS